MTKYLYHPYSLIVKLLFGCGLRQFECLQLRVRDFNFDAGILTIHGKGKKGRTVPLPEVLIDQLRAQIKRVTDLHVRDLADGYDGVFLDDAVEKKYPKAPKELVHQWFFPQRSLTELEATGQRRRWHIHESKLQKALYIAVKKRTYRSASPATPSATPSPPTFCKQAMTSASFRPCWGTPA